MLFPCTHRGDPMTEYAVVAYDYTDDALTLRLANPKRFDPTT